MSVIFVIILVATIVISYQGFNNYPFFNRYKFNIREVKRGDYIRLISSGFLHADWSHLIFNMLSLYFFQGIIVQTMGSFLFLVIYFGSMVLGSIFILLFCNWGFRCCFRYCFCCYCTFSRFYSSKFYARVDFWNDLLWIFCLYDVKSSTR